MSSPKKITVVISDQHYIVRLGVRTALARDRSLRVLGDAENGREAVRLVKRLRPDVLISGISMPLLNGLEAAWQIMSSGSRTRVLILSAQLDDRFIERAICRVKVSGYLAKATAIDTLPAAVRAVAEGRTAFSPEIISHLKRHGHLYSDREKNGLTPRQVEVIQLVGDGKFNKEIQSELNCGISYVKKVLDQIEEKLGVAGRRAIAEYAWKAGHSQGQLN